MERISWQRDIDALPRACTVLDSLDSSWEAAANTIYRSRWWTTRAWSLRSLFKSTNACSYLNTGIRTMTLWRRFPWANTPALREEAARTPPQVTCTHWRGSCEAVLSHSQCICDTLSDTHVAFKCKESNRLHPDFSFLSLTKWYVSISSLLDMNRHRFTNTHPSNFPEFCT